VRDLLRVEPGTSADLARRNTGDKLGLDKETASAELEALNARLATLQNRLYAERRRSVLLVLQGLDASGKDGTIKRVLTGVNPMGCHVRSFTAPTEAELDHDYLWRIHDAMPARGHIGCFNRSHYEDLTTTVVLGLIGATERKQRYEQVREFERILHDEGTTIVKVFLNLGKNEQRVRLQARLDDPEKRWKFNRGDLETRKRWDEYVHVYDQAISHTSTEWAPWYVVPADHKWVSAVAVATLLVSVLEEMDPQIPASTENLDGVEVV